MSDLQPPEVVQSWLGRARSDLLLGRAGLRTKGVLLEDACFHAQQSAEKALKGLLTHLGIPFPLGCALYLGKCFCKRDRQSRTRKPYAGRSWSRRKYGWDLSTMNMVRQRRTLLLALGDLALNIGDIRRHYGVK